MPGWPRWDGDGENTVVTEEKCPGSGGELPPLPPLPPLWPHIIVCHFSGGSAAGSSGRRGLAGAGPNFVVMGAAPGTLAVDTVTLGPSC